MSVLALGDSLTAGWGLPESLSFPALLEDLFRQDGLDVQVFNAGLSGDTSEGGLARLEWILSEFGGQGPDVAVVELGANDALRGMDPALTEANLDAILTRLTKRGALVLLAGMKAPPNYGQDYASRFQAIFPRLAARHRTAFYPFFLEGVAGSPSLNQPDGIHPNAQGAPVVARAVYPHVKALVEQTLSRRAGKADPDVEKK